MTEHLRNVIRCYQRYANTLLEQRRAEEARAGCRTKGADDIDRKIRNAEYLISVLIRSENDYGGRGE